MEKSFTVYKHTNKANNKVYIGITSMPPEKRWKNGNGYKQNKHFYSAIEKYGWDSFQHDIILNGVSKERACEEEKRLIKESDSTNPLFGYNSSIGGESGVLGIKMKEGDKEKRRKSSLRAWADKELREAQRNRRLGIKKSEETKEKMRYAQSHRSKETRDKQAESLRKYYSVHDMPSTKRAIYCVETGTEYESAREAERITGVCSSNITACCKGKRGKAGGLHWQYANTEVTTETKESVAP